MKKIKYHALDCLALVLVVSSLGCGGTDKTTGSRSAPGSGSPSGSPSSAGRSSRPSTVALSPATGEDDSNLGVADHAELVAILGLEQEWQLGDDSKARLQKAKKEGIYYYQEDGGCLLANRYLEHMGTNRADPEYFISATSAACIKRSIPNCDIAKTLASQLVFVATEINDRCLKEATGNEADARLLIQRGAEYAKALAFINFKSVNVSSNQKTRSE